MLKEYVEKRKELLQKLILSKKEECYKLNLDRNKIDELEISIADYEKIKKPGFLAKVFKTKKFKDYDVNHVIVNDLKVELEDMKKKVNTDDVYFNRQFDELDLLEKEYNLLSSQLPFNELINKLNISLKDIISILHENNVPIIISDKERDYIKKVYPNSNDEFKSFDDVVLVHKTNYAPSNNTINTDVSTNTIHEAYAQINGRTYSYNLRPYDDVVHYTINKESRESSYGKLVNYKYGFLLKASDIPKDEIQSFEVGNVYFKNNIVLPKGTIIFCPSEEMEDIKKSNNNCVIIGYNSELFLGYINTFIQAMGYPIELLGDIYFYGEKIDSSFKNIQESIGFKDKNIIFGYDKRRFASKKGLSIIHGILELIINNEKFKNVDYLRIINDNDLYNIMSGIVRNGYSDDLGLIFDELGIELDVNNMNQDKLLSESIIEAAIIEAQKMSGDLDKRLQDASENITKKGTI